MRVVIVGAGLIGLTTAHVLTQAGAEVVLVERSVVGSGAARGNAGQVCPDQATPMAKTSLIVSALTQVYRKDSALHVSAGTLPGYLSFLLKVAQNSVPSKYAANLAALRQVESVATQAFLDFAEEIGVDVSNKGYLHVYSTQEAAREGRKSTLARLADSQMPHRVGEVLDPSSLVSIEPTLNPTGYGFLDEGSFFTNPIHYVETLHQRLVDAGVEIHEGTGATSVTEREGRQVLHTTRGDFAGDSIIITAGVGSADVAAASGCRFPLKPGKGYSFSVKLDRDPLYVFKFESAHVAGLPLGEKSLRIAGTMEFDGDRDRFNASRIRQIVAAVGPYLPSAALESRSEEWVGARPLTPDGIPVVDKLPGLSSTYIAAGHNMLGLMHAPFTAEILKDMVLRRGMLRHRQFAASRTF
ncbi:NAD(P)/FAD-dependent oxidoreductase [Brevibacterium aurantiacum]|uniref:D-amino-acid dehydrogenase n=3 Tax=Brevibacterium aurantiacum TaxID=273384 RepID=A0A2H1KRJ1_BREAU|nr:FAD-dependent oxidoreductase [Brevibacterium aurantiacum]MDN6499786.1 FAD-binding oxidoreductase [Yaniella sp.]AZL12561.1 FAD-binding oxidoreductase [Brevibacterium aurantiacum]AZT96823.1 FAD-binding oxidoreductase [Brevibacterium aurantiacum]PCC44491.1 hypothetical protein CIK65_02595 [Brevibacterium aurantiacum]RCS86391.1 FAD-binding oxidoreductase [Brevibacterium aurantiacum]